MYTQVEECLYFSRNNLTVLHVWNVEPAVTLYVYIHVYIYIYIYIYVQYTVLYSEKM